MSANEPAPATVRDARDARDARGPRRPRDRDVLLLAATIVIGVLALRLLGELVPGLDQVLGTVPLLIVMLIVVTAVVLLRALHPRRDRDPRRDGDRA